ncbi:peptide-methionine (S)-S-oxide reductase [Candidatus Curtissbacteria bacterium RIFCSPLOWO2_02_FULL_40_11]|uniref:Peptide methionine sulfoxide reductase MsrA n=2 Tax=Candidatus Curtissiibacteriota TaxID=1752717 RepID=A0A1F5GC86_9BACT|nr:MAG: peptide-methionine (S)-S-oxide reductase [Candidatus Curtissbacteria bacterium RIFCSPHIGHO2_02_FULL_40_16b]OGE00517.1 MAG: peptide-methionine (S)-S-oxide reductase [Candidatus Curtissbacteria bacterium RIFCSPLOWO2_02_FULL_40_11]OGE13243.1 MAG: peptide-methionine (S)-S-oxide reductase [Candidatus Curtissbacteria bacterium RIFCSPLOWO2_12_FULL_38_9]
MAKLDTATLAGGCFWCTEAIFKRIKGVSKVISGYSGGRTENPNYDQVSQGSTGHAESIQLEFDPEIISYEKLLEVFFHLHDPTTLNRQGNDVGPQYRSAIFYHSDEQKKIAQKIKAKIKKEKVYAAPIVTEILPYQNFFKAKESHQNYYDSNRNQPYCQVIIDPKIKKLMKEFKTVVKRS